MAVRFDNELKATIRKVVASYNRKLKYYEKKGIKGLPEKASYKTVASLGSRKSIKNELKALTKLNAKSIDRIVLGGTLTTQFEKDKITKRLASSRKILKGRINKLANLELKYFGKKTGVTLGEQVSMLDLMGSLKQGRLRNDKLISNLRKYEIVSGVSASDYINMTKSERESFDKLLNRIESPYVNPKFKQSYTDMIIDLGYTYGVDKDKLNKIEKSLSKLSDEEFDKLFTEDLAFKRAINYYVINQVNLGIMDNKDEVENLFNNMYENIGFMTK